MKRILHIVLVLVAVAACQGPRVIPKDTLTDIYVDMFLADQQVREEGKSSKQMDTLLVYEAVFNKYGYDTDDYQNSVRHYLRDPERFAKIFEEVTKRLSAEVSALDKIIEYNDQLASKKGRKYPLVDSLLAPFSKDAVSVALARVERDPSRYPALFRLVAVQADTLMVAADSLDAKQEEVEADLPAENEEAEKPGNRLIIQETRSQVPIRVTPKPKTEVEEPKENMRVQE